MDSWKSLLRFKYACLSPAGLLVDVPGVDLGLGPTTRQLGSKTMEGLNRNKRPERNVHPLQSGTRIHGIPIGFEFWPMAIYRRTRLLLRSLSLGPWKTMLVLKSVNQWSMKGHWKPVWIGMDRTWHWRTPVDQNVFLISGCWSSEWGAQLTKKISKRGTVTIMR